MQHGERKKQKILYLITKSNWGGAQRYLYDLATRLPRRTVEVLVGAGGNGVLLRRLEDSGIRTISIPGLDRDFHIRHDLRAFFNLLRLIKKERPDVVHLNSPKVGGMGALAARLADITTIIYTAHGWPFKERRPRLWRIMAWFFSWLTALLSTTLVTVSHDDAREARRFPFAYKKVTTIPLGILPQNFTDRVSARRELLRENLPDNVVLIGTIAELNRNKGISVAIEAMHLLQRGVTSHPPSLPPFRYVIIGDGEERPVLEKLIKDRGLSTVVFLVGERDHAAQLLPAFDIFLLPSLKEGLPYVLLEAGLAGLPVVATNVGGIPEAVDDMISGIIIKPADVRECKKTLTFLLTRPEKRMAFGAVLRRTVRMRFPFRRAFEATRRLYLPTDQQTRVEPAHAERHGGTAASP